MKNRQHAKNGTDCENRTRLLGRLMLGLARLPEENLRGIEGGLDTAIEEAEVYNPDPCGIDLDGDDFDVESCVGRMTAKLWAMGDDYLLGLADLIADEIHEAELVAVD